MSISLFCLLPPLFQLRLPADRARKNDENNSLCPLSVLLAISRVILFRPDTPDTRTPDERAWGAEDGNEDPNA